MLILYYYLVQHNFFVFRYISEDQIRVDLEELGQIDPQFDEAFDNEINNDDDYEVDHEEENEDDDEGMILYSQHNKIIKKGKLLRKITVQKTFYLIF